LGFRPGAVHRGRGHQAGQRQPQAIAGEVAETVADP
jgi:hypothetical protein